MSSPFSPSPGNQDPFNYNQPANSQFGGQPYGSPQFGGQQLGGTGYGLPPQRPASLSMQALFSLLAGIISPIFICVCMPYITAVVALAAVVLGHIALVKINRSRGALSGGGLAVGGLVIGYPVLMLGLVFSMAFLLPQDFGKRPPGYENTPAGRLDAAESKINSDGQGISHGNTPEAKALADKYAKTMKSLREALFTKGKKGISLSGGNFITYCELHDGRCAFITHVPEYRKFSKDAKESLTEIAWLAAQETVADTLAEGDELGVGLKGVLSYGSVMIGHVTLAGDEKRGLQQQSELEEQLLEPFFELEENELPRVPPIQLDEPAKPGQPATVPPPESKP